MSKSFKNAPKPGTLAAIEAFERGGPGHDTTKAQTHITTKPPEAEKTKRLSIDLPESLHHRFKKACVGNKLSMVTEVLAFIERRTKELEQK